MKRRRKIGPTLAVLVAIAATGCQSVNTVQPADRVNPPRIISDERVITDPSLERRVAVVEVHEAESEGGHLRVQVRVQNTTRRYRTFNYRFEWFDKDGFLIETPASGYRSRHIEGGESLMLVGVAPTATSKDFKLKLIEDVR
jgi:uncharacterized protein YcfL